MAVTESPGASLPFYKRKRFIEGFWGWTFAGWVVVGTLALNILPAIPNLYLSLTQWTSLGDPTFIGLKNYEEIFFDSYDAYNAFFRTIEYSVMQIPANIICGLLLALLVNQKLKGMTLYRAVFYLPVVSSMIAISMIFGYILSPRFGLLNQFLIETGIADNFLCPALPMMRPCPPNWFGDDFLAMLAIVIVAVYTSMGYNMVLFLAGLQGIPEHLYEAAKIDGAGSLMRFRHVTLPLITPTLFFILVLGVIGSFSVFGLVMTLTAGGPGRATEVIFFYLYDETFERLRFGYGSALSVVMFAVIAILTAMNWYLSKRWVFYG